FEQGAQYARDLVDETSADFGRVHAAPSSRPPFGVTQLPSKSTEARPADVASRPLNFAMSPTRTLIGDSRRTPRFNTCPGSMLSNSRVFKRVWMSAVT